MPTTSSSNSILRTPADSGRARFAEGRFPAAFRPPQESYRHGVIRTRPRRCAENKPAAVRAGRRRNQNSYSNIESWLNEIKSQANPEIKIFLIGNKIDLKDQRQIDAEDAKQFSKDHAFNYFIETSAKNGFNAQAVFVRAAKELYMTHLEYKDRASRIGSMANPQIPYQTDINMNNFVLDEEEDKSRKKKG